MNLEILISTYNRKVFLEKAIKSVIDQTFSEFKLTIVNSGSTDNTSEYLKSLTDDRINILSFSDNLGISGNIERAIGQASERYVVLFHDDDLMESKFLETYMDNLELGCILYHCNVNFIDEKDNLFEDQARPTICNYIERGEYSKKIVTNRNTASIIMPTVIIDTKIIKDNGAWPLVLNSQLTMLVDMGIWLQLNRFGKFKYIDKKLINYRLHSNSGTSSFSSSFNEMLNNRISVFKELFSINRTVPLKIRTILFFIKSILFDIKKSIS